MTSPPVNAIDPQRTLLSRVMRVGGYAAWTTGGVALTLGIDRLVVCPLLNESLGNEVFGAFVWTMGLVNLFGSIGANGFAILLLREMAGHSAEKANSLFCTSLSLGSLCAIVIVAASLAASLPFADAFVRANASPLFVMLGAFAIARGLELIVFANLRIERRFVTIFLLRVVEAAILLINVKLAGGGNLWLIGGVYAASAIVVLPLGLGTCASRLRGGRWWDSGHAKLLMAGWAAGALLTLLEQMNVYASRLVLGAVEGSASVASLYRGTSIGNIFVVPVGLVGGVVLSMLAGKTEFVLKGRTGGQYVAISAACGAGVGLCSLLLGGWVVRRQYGSLADDTLSFYFWIAIANGFTALSLMLRPVAMKYLPLKRLTLVSLLVVLIQFGALAVLVPSAQARGAAMALAGSSAVGSVLWLWCFVWASRRAEETRREAAAAEEAFTGDGS